MSPYVTKSVQISVYCAKRSFQSVVHENLLSVRASSVLRPENNWFLWRGYGGWTRAAVYWYFELLILKDPKSEHLSKSLRAGIGRFRDPFWSLNFVTFWQEVSKNVIAQKSPYLGIDSSSNQCSWSDVRGTWQGSWEISRENTDEVRRFAPLPCTVNLV